MVTLGILCCTNHLNSQNLQGRKICIGQRRKRAAYLCELKKFVGRAYDLIKAMYGWSCALTGTCWVMIYRRAAILNCSSLNFVWISQRKKIVDSGVGVGMTADGI